MNSRFIKIFYIFLLSIVTLAPLDVYAETLNDTEKAIMELNSEYESKKAEMENSKQSQEETLAELENIRAQQIQVEADISSTKTKISDKKTEISEIEAKIPKMQKQADIILVQTQQASNQNYLLQAVFNAKGASEALRSIEAYSTLSKASGNFIIELIELQATLEQEKINLETEEQNLQLQEHQLELDEAYAEDMIAYLTAQVQAAESSMDETAIMLQAKEDQLKMLEDAGCTGDDVYGIDCGTMNNATGFIRPINYGYVTNEFNGFDGTTGGSTGHRGIDLSSGSGSSGYGAPIYPVAAGKVMIAESQYDSNYGSTTGNWVTILHLYEGRNITSSYLHMNSAPLVSAGQTVSVADQVGEIGETGLAYGAHLHLGMFDSGFYLVNPVDPRKYINFPAPWVSFNGRY